MRKTFSEKNTDKVVRTSGEVATEAPDTKAEAEQAVTETVPTAEQPAGERPETAATAETPKAEESKEPQPATSVKAHVIEEPTPQREPVASYPTTVVAKIARQPHGRVSTALALFGLGFKTLFGGTPKRR